MSWGDQYLKHTQPVRVFSLERDAIEDYGYDSDIDDEDAQDDAFDRIRLCESSPRLATIRAQAYRRAWEACQNDIRTVLQGIYNDTIAQLHAFVRSAPTRARYGQRALATGIILGANRTVASALAAALHDANANADTSDAGSSNFPRCSRRTCVARIASRGCLNKRAALKTVIQAIIASGRDDAEHDVENDRRTTGKKLSTAAVDDMETLVAWYESKYHNQDEAPRLAIYFEDLETFDSVVLTNLIEILSTYARRLPLILLLAISTSISALHTLLPRSTSELLRIATFTVTPNIETFHSLVFETFVKRSQIISPGSKVFAFLRDTFLDLNQSIDEVIAKLKYMHLAHFYGNPFSILCTDLPEETETEEQLDLLGEIVPSLRTLPSFQKTIEDSTQEGFLKNDRMILKMTEQLLESDKELLRSVNASRREKEFYTRNLPQAWSLFDTLQSSWTEGRLSTETLLTDYFADKLLTRTTSACRNLRNARDDVVLDYLRRVQEVFATSKVDTLNLRDDLATLESLVETGTRQAGLTRLVNGNIQGSVAKSEGDKQFTNLVKVLSEKLDKYFRTHLKPFTELTFHEIWYPDVHRVMRSAFHPHIIDQIQSTLITPSSRLPLHLIDDTENLPAVDDLDVCRAYKLVSEAGKLVNLADWYGAFEVALDDIEKEVEGKDSIIDDRREKRRKTVGKMLKSSGKARSGNTDMLDTNGHHDAVEDEGDSEDEATMRTRAHQARFLAAAADLSYLGYIQPTKRKAEHVARIVF